MLVGVVDTGRVLAESNAGKAVAKELQRRGQSWQEQLAVTEEQVEQDRKKLKEQGQKLAAKERFSLELKARLGSEMLQQLQKRAQIELEAYSEFYQAVLSQTLAGVLDVLGKEKSYGLILTGPNAQMPFVGESNDITLEAIKRFDANFKMEQL